MNWTSNFPTLLFERLVTTSTTACLVVILLVLVKAAFGKRLSPRWHYILWFVLVAKLILPEKFNIPFRIKNMTPEQPLSQIDDVFRALPTLTPKLASGIPVTIKVLFSVWLVGFLIVLLHNLLANWHFSRKLRDSAQWTDAETLCVLGECKRLMNVRKHIRLVESELISSPAVFGFLRPRLLLPAPATLVIRPEQLKYVILHELAHVKRNDIAAIQVMRVLLAIHWFNPLLWYAYYRMREDQEIACDAFVLSRVGREETRPYVQTLIELVEAASVPARIPGLAGISGTMRKFKRRMSTILSLQPYSFGRSMFGLLLFIALGLLTLTTVRTTVDASGVFEAAYTPNAADRIMPISAQGGWQKNLLITNRNGEWKIVFITETGEPDPEMADAEGILTVPESGYYSRPGVRNLEFVKGPDDKEWKLVYIREAVN